MNKSRQLKLQTLFKAEHQRLYVSALAVTRQRSCAEDAVHDALVAVAEVATEPDDLKAYLYRVVRNKALHIIKGRSAMLLSNVNEDVGNSIIEALVEPTSDSLELHTLAEQVNKHIQQLDSNVQQVLIMKLYSDFTFEEIASITDNSPNTVASWYRRGLVQLKEMIHGPQKLARIV